MKLPVIPSRDPIKTLGNICFKPGRQRGSHITLVHGAPPRREVAPPNHVEIRRGGGRRAAVRAQGGGSRVAPHPRPAGDGRAVDGPIASYIRQPCGIPASMRQKAVQEPAGVVPGSTSAPGGEETAGAWQHGARAGLPEPGSRFSDEELGARLGVPTTGSIRVSHENRCIVLVDRLGGDGTGGGSVGDIVRCAGQDLGGGGDEDQALDGANLDLALSRARRYAVLGFSRESEEALVLDRVVECDSLCFEKCGGRSVIVFRMRVVGGGACDCEGPSPEVERALQSIEAGTSAGKRYTIDEYVEHIKTVMG